MCDYIRNGGTHKANKNKPYLM